MTISWDFFQANSTTVSWHGCWCISLRKSLDIIILSFCNIVTGQAMALLKSNVILKFLAFLMQWISSIFQKCCNIISSISKKCCIIISSISKKCQKFITSKMLDIKSRHLTWVGHSKYYIEIVSKQKIAKAQGRSQKIRCHMSFLNQSYHLLCR